MQAQVHETQQSISDWADQTFGPVSSNFRVAARANEEMAELLRALSAGDEAKAREEAADVAIVLARLATRLGGSYDLTIIYEDQRAPARHATWANFELAMLLRQLDRDICSNRDALNYVQDTVSHLEATVRLLGSTLQAEINSKMRVNRARTWKLDGSGHGYHVRPEKVAQGEWDTR